MASIEGGARRRNARGHFVKKAITAEQRRQIAAKYGCSPGKTIEASCAYCNAIGQITWFVQPRGKGWVSFSGLEMDHVVAEYRGGETHCRNLTLACVKCNRSKSHKAVADWRPRGAA